MRKDWFVTSCGRWGFGTRASHSPLHSRPSTPYNPSQASSAWGPCRADPLWELLGIFVQKVQNWNFQFMDILLANLVDDTWKYTTLTQKTCFVPHKCNFGCSKPWQNEGFLSFLWILIIEWGIKNALGPRFADIRTQIQLFLIRSGVDKCPMLLSYSRKS